jgi:hypothetical protein
MFISALGFFLEVSNVEREEAIFLKDFSNLHFYVISLFGIAFWGVCSRFKFN